MDNHLIEPSEMAKAKIWKHWKYFESLTISESLEFVNAVFTFAATCEAYTRRGAGKSHNPHLDRAVSNLSACVQYFVSFAKKSKHLDEIYVTSEKVAFACNYMRFEDVLRSMRYTPVMYTIDNGNHHLLESNLNKPNMDTGIALLQMTINRPETDVTYNPFEGEHQ